MQTLEAIISLFMLVSFLSLISTDWETPIKKDNAVYQFQLVNDVWRVLYLRGDFTDFSFDWINNARDKAESDILTIGDVTSYCIFIGGERLTNCRGEEIRKIITTERLTLVDGNPQTVTVSLGIRK